MHADRERLRREIEAFLNEQNARALADELNSYWDKTGLCLRTLLPPLDSVLDQSAKAVAEEHFGALSSQRRINASSDRLLDYGLACLLEGFGYGLLWRHYNQLNEIPTCQHPAEPRMRRGRRQISADEPRRWRERPARRRIDETKGRGGDASKRGRT
jgi:hypothetical protein